MKLLSNYIRVIVDLIKHARKGSVLVFVQGPGDALIQNTGALHFVLTICSKTSASPPNVAKKLWMTLGAAVGTIEVRTTPHTKQHNID